MTKNKHDSFVTIVHHYEIFQSNLKLNSGIFHTLGYKAEVKTLLKAHPNEIRADFIKTSMVWIFGLSNDNTIYM